jgi:glutathione synthase/RimK-type ligase-like ATP-grasp enzyme
MDLKLQIFKSSELSVGFQVCKIGILAPFNQNLCCPIGKQTSLITSFFKTGDKYNLQMAIFEPEDLVNKFNVKTGFEFNSNIWKKGWFLAPDVLYDRYPSTLMGFDRTVEQFKDILVNERGCHFLNPVSLARTLTDKAACFFMMKSIGISTPEVINVHYLTSQLLSEVINQHRSIILKPRFGRMGRGIIRISQDVLRYITLYKNHCFMCKTRDELYGIIRSIGFQNQLNLSDYIIQPEIKILKYKGKYFDVRVLMQRRDGQQPPEIVGSVIRINSSESVVPNIDQGGIVSEVSSWFVKIVGEKKSGELIERIESLCSDIYRLLELKFGLIAELGIDLLVDNELRIWVVEINSKPGRIAFQRLGFGFGIPDTEKKQYLISRQKSIENPILFAKWILENVIFGKNQ